MKYLSLDIETTGLDPSYCEVIEVAMIVDDLRNPIFDHSPALRLLIQPSAACGGQFTAFKMNTDLILAAIGSGIPLPTAKSRIKDFLDEHFGTNQKIVVAGKNVQFDLSFVRSWIPRQIHHRYLDPTILLMESTDDVPPSLTECLKRANISGLTLHSALDDAIAICKLIRSEIN